jgi:hypothetical protein
MKNMQVNELNLTICIDVRLVRAISVLCFKICTCQVLRTYVHLFTPERAYQLMKWSINMNTLIYCGLSGGAGYLACMVFFKGILC